MAPVAELTFGCQILVINFIFGGANGYSPSIKMSTSNTPFSYGVPEGPWMVPIKCLQPGLPGMERSSPAVVAITPEVGSVLHIMEISFLTRPFAAIFSGVAVVYC